MQRKGRPLISLRGLECLVAILDHGSLTKAAAVLHLSQPALSHQIASIERELGTPVVERLARGVRPTAAGLAAGEQARVALAAAGKAVTAARHAAAGTDGRIRIACEETMSSWLLIPVVRDWRRDYAGVAIELREYTSADRVLDVLLAGGADIAISPPAAVADGRAEVLGVEEMVVVAAPGHRFAAMDAVPLAELAAEPLIHYSPGNGNCAWVDWFAASRGVNLPQPVIRTGSAHTAALLAGVGVGVAVVSVSALTPRPDATIRPFDPPELRDVTVTVAAPRDELVARFLADLKKHGVPGRS